MKHAFLLHVFPVLQILLLLLLLLLFGGSRGSVVAQAGRSRVRDPIRRIIFSMYLILPAVLDPGAYSASNRTEYQKQKIMFLGIKARPVRTADNLTAICEPYPRVVGGTR
jgi:hypothetical protein